jgi:hypothetical protein
VQRSTVSLLGAAALAFACSGGEDAPPPSRDPYVAAPAPASTAGTMGFLQGVPPVTAEPAGIAFPRSANAWDLGPDLSLLDGGDDQFDGALALYVGTVGPTPTFEGLRAQVDGPVALEPFPADQIFSGLDFFGPVLGSAELDLAAVADGSFWPPLGGARSAFLAPTADSRLQQAIDLSDVDPETAEPVLLRWTDDVAPFPGLVDGTDAHYRLVLRDATTGSEVARLVDGTSATSGPHEQDLVAYAGRWIVLSFEYASAGLGLAEVDDVSVKAQNGLGAERVENGDFEAGDLTGWSVATVGQSQNLTTAPRPLGGLEVTRGFYTAPGSTWARWVDLFSNPDASPVSRDVVYRSVLGSEGAGIVYATPGANAHSLTSWDGSWDGLDPVVVDGDLAIVHGTGQAFFVSSDGLGSFGGSPEVFVLHRITVPAGGAVAIVQYVVLDGTDTGATATSASARALAVDGAAAEIAAGIGTDPAFLDWLTPAQSQAAIANW